MTPYQQDSSESTPATAPQSTRAEAEEFIRSNPLPDVDVSSSEAITEVLHELRVHQIELEMQNEALRDAQAALLESKARYFDLYDLAPVGYLTLDEKNSILESNLAAVTMLAGTREEIGQYPFTRYILPDDQAHFYRHRKRLFAGDPIEPFELRLIRKNDETFWARLDASLAIDADSKQPHCLLTIIDIDEAKHQEAAIALSERKYRFLMESLTEGIWYIDQNAETTFVNAPMAAMLGYTVEEMLGRHLFAFMDERGVELAKRNLAARQAGVAERHDFEFLRKDGARLYASLDTGPIFDERGTYIGSLAAVQDITQRRHAEVALQRSQRNLAQAQRIGQIGSWEWDVQQAMLFWSDELYRIFGLATDFPLTYASIEGMIHPDDRALNSATVQEILTGGQPVEFQFRLVRPDGEIRQIEQQIVAECGADGTPTRLIGIMQDITERKRAEAERAALTERLAEAERLEMVGHLAGGIAHDFNNMLAVILMRAELGTQMAGPDGRIRRQFEEINQTGQRSAALVRQLLGFARRQVIVRQVLDLSAIVDGMLPMVQQLLGEGIVLNFRRGADLWPVRMDPTQIDQILVNLCVNARDAIPSTGHVTIATANVGAGQNVRTTGFDITPGDYVVLSVADDGCGIERDALAHVFEPFYTTKPIGKGTGLGLATVYGIVKQNGGDIQVYSEVGIGTTFNVFLPRFANDVMPAPSAARTTPLPRARGETILLVEDKAELLQSTAEALRHLGYVVLEAASPAEAERLAAGAFDLLMTDIIMPGMDGRALAARITARQPQVKCLYVSGYSAEFIASRGLIDEGVHFLQKPFSLAALAATIREALSN